MFWAIATSQLVFCTTFKELSITELLLKAGRTAENRKIRYLEQFEERRRHREKLYGRLIKVEKYSFLDDLISFKQLFL